MRKEKQYLILSKSIHHSISSKNIWPCQIDSLPGSLSAELLVAAAEPGPEVTKLFSCSTQ